MKKSILGALIVMMFVAVGIAAAPPLTFTFSDVRANKTAMGRTLSRSTMQARLPEIMLTPRGFSTE